MSFDNLPDPWGRYGAHGGRYVPETLMTALEELVSAYRAAREDAGFESQLSGYLSTYVGAAHAAVLRREPVAQVWRRSNLPEARGPGAHGGAQD